MDGRQLLGVPKCRKYLLGLSGHIEGDREGLRSEEGAPVGEKQKHNCRKEPVEGISGRLPEYLAEAAEPQGPHNCVVNTAGLQHMRSKYLALELTRRSFEYRPCDSEVG